MNKIIQGNALDKLKELDSESVDCCITSPPYWALRDYKTEGQLGLEPTFTEYIQRLVETFSEVKRVLKKTGSCWVNLGDTYAQANIRNRNGLGSDTAQQKEGVNFLINTRERQAIPEKSLCLIPERFSIAMISDGWILRNKIIWYKPNCMPSSAKDRFTVDWEHLFFFVKNQRYYFDTQYEPLQESTIERDMRGLSETHKNIESSHTGLHNPDYHKKYRQDKWPKFGGNKAAGYENPTYSGEQREIKEVVDEATRRNAIARGWNPETHSYADWYFNLREKKSWHNHENDALMGNGQQKRGEPFQKLNFPYGRIKRCVWKIPTRGFPEAHFATFPPELIETPIKATCPTEGLVLDPFMGAGTVGLVAMQNARNFLGIELNQSYIDMAMERLKPYLLQTRLPI
jgi:DNA modification methylase